MTKLMSDKFTGPRVRASRDVQFQATYIPSPLLGATILVSGFLGGHRTCDSYTFTLAEWPAHPFDQLVLASERYGVASSEAPGAHRKAEGVAKAVAAVLEMAAAQGALPERQAPDPSFDKFCRQNGLFAVRLGQRGEI